MPDEIKDQKQPTMEEIQAELANLRAALATSRKQSADLTRKLAATEAVMEYTRAHGPMPNPGLVVKTVLDEVRLEQEGDKMRLYVHPNGRELHAVKRDGTPISILDRLRDMSGEAETSLLFSKASDGDKGNTRARDEHGRFNAPQLSPLERLAQERHAMFEGTPGMAAMAKQPKQEGGQKAPADIFGKLAQERRAMLEGLQAAQQG